MPLKLSLTLFGRVFLSAFILSKLIYSKKLNYIIKDIALLKKFIYYDFCTVGARFSRNLITHGILDIVPLVCIVYPIQANISPIYMVGELLVYVQSYPT